MSKQPTQIYRFRVSLLGIEPEIWRIIEVPENYTFWDLHVAIQDAMAWLDYHLHMFMPDPAQDSDTKPIGIPEGPEDEEYVASWTVPITEHFTEPGDAAQYVYDFGDDWCHSVRLEAVEPRKPGVAYPRCPGGARACPPEDCGSVPGYYELLDILAHPRHEQYKEMVTWLKHHAKDYWPYDPDAFDPAGVEFWDPKKRWNIMMGLEEP